MKSLDLTTEQYQTIEDIAYIGYSPEQIAMVLEVSNIDLFVEHAQNPESAIYLAIHRNSLQSQFDINSNAIVSAKGGNVTAMQRLDKIRHANEFDAHKRRIIYGR